MRGNLNSLNNKNIKFGVVLTYASVFFSIVNTLVLTPIILNNVGDSNYGFYSFALSITTWIPVLTNALTASYIRFATRNEKNENTPRRVTSVYFKIITLFCIVFSLLFVIVLLFLYYANIQLPQYSGGENKIIYILILFSSISSFSSIFFSVFTLYLNFRQKFIFVETLKLAIAIVGFVTKLILIPLTRNVFFLVIVDLISTIAIGVITIMFAFIRQNIEIDIKIKLKENKFLIKEIIGFSSFLLLNNLAEQINNHLDVTILGLFVDSESVATYQLSFTFCNYLATIPVAIATLFIPKINEYYVNNEICKIHRLFLKVSHLQTIFVIMIIFGYMTCGKEFICMWIGYNRVDIFAYSLPLLITHSVPLTVNVAIEIQRAYSKHKFRAVSLLIIALVNALSSTIMVLLIPSEYAVWACIFCTVVSKVIGVWILFNIYNSKVIGLPIRTYLSDFTHVLLKAFVCYAAALGIKHLLLQSHSASTFAVFLASGLSFVIFYTSAVLLRDRVLHNFITNKEMF